MATANPFDLLGDDDTDDVSHLIALQQKKKAAEKPVVAAAPATKQLSKPAAVAKLPSKPAPPAQAVKEAKSESVRGGGRSGVGGGRGYGRRDGGGYNRDLSGNDTSFGSGERGGGGRGYGRRDGGGYNRDSGRNENSFSNSESGGGQGAIRETDSGRTFERRGGYGGFRGERRGGYSNGEEGEGDRVRRVFERRSGTGRGNEIKREGSGRNNWGSQTDELPQVNEEVTNEGEKDTEKPSVEFDGSDGNKEKSTNEPEVKEPEVKEMTLEEYEKVLEEKRKALEALKMEERKVEIDKELAAMQLLSSKKGSDDIFVKLGSDKDKRKEIAEKEEKAKKSLSINEFLKPAEGEKYFSGGRGRGRGRGSRGGFGGSSGMSSYAEAPAIGDPSEFPTLGAK